MKQPGWVVKKAIPRDDHTIVIEFADGKQGIYDATALLKEPMYSPLNSLDFFMKAHAEYDTVVWSDDVDIAPEHLYETCVPLTDAVYTEQFNETTFGSMYASDNKED